MGRGRGRNNRTQRRHFKQNRENVWKDSESDPQPSTAGEGIAAIAVNTNRNNSRDTGWNPFVTENVFFEEYYKGQGIVLPDEWDTFMEILRKPLPSAFRINSSGQFYLDILSQLENDFVKSLQTEFIEGDEAAAIRPLPWYPENLAWHSNFSRKEIRKNQTLERFHEFLKLANDIGNITRQEAVSMVPPLFLDVHPDHFVLDMCAAPGSKTFQLLEIIHQSSQPGALPCGMVIANDVDIQRSNLLIHQTKRMCTANLVVTNHEAQNFPGCNLRKHNFKASEARTAEGLAMNQLLFDRVLCDVPCSGDGTLRKAPDMWRRWNTGMGNGLHNLQLLIAMRGMSLLKVGGRMVYSTCSMNPVENEAVVAEILRRCKDSVELVDISKELPQLVRRPGLKSWKVWDKGQWLVSYKDVKKYRRVGIMPSMFPSGRADTYSPNNNDVGDPDSGDMRVMSVEPVSENGLHGKTEEFVSSSAKEEFSCFPLEHCMRIVPHDQNTGAFFIAVFHKLSPIPVGDAVLGVEEPLPCETINFESGQDDNVSDAGESEATNGESSKEMVIEDSTGGELPKASLESEKPFDTVSKDEAFPGDLKDEPCCITEANGAHDGPENRSSTTGLGDAGGKRKLQTQGRWKGVDPVLFYKDENVIYCIKTFYGIVDSFPLNGHLISRNIDNNHVKRIYYISKSVKDILELNLLVGHQLKLASVGVKMFERQTSQDGHASSCLFRISSEGLPLLLPYITKQILHVSAHDLCHLLQKKSVKFGDFVTAESGEKASQLLLGCCVVALEEDGPLSADPVNVSSSTIAIGCWRGRTNISVMVAANDCQDLLDRLLARMEAKGISLPEKVDSSGLEVKGDRQCRNELKGEMNEAVKLDEVKCSS